MSTTAAIVLGLTIVFALAIAAAPAFKTILSVNNSKADPFLGQSVLITFAGDIGVSGTVIRLDGGRMWLADAMVNGLVADGELEVNRAAALIVQVL